MEGGTLWAWCKLAEPDATVVSVDLPGGAYGGGYDDDAVRRFRSYASRGQRLEFVQRDSHDPETVAAVESILGPAMLDFLFIDGDHSYEGVKQDCEMYAPLVRRGGLIAFHDVLPHPEVPDCQVDRFWTEVRKNRRHLEFLYPEDIRSWGQWGGIGVLYAE